MMQPHHMQYYGRDGPFSPLPPPAAGMSDPSLIERMHKDEQTVVTTPSTALAKSIQEGAMNMDPTGERMVPPPSVAAPRGIAESPLAQLPQPSASPKRDSSSRERERDSSPLGPATKRTAGTSTDSGKSSKKVEKSRDHPRSQSREKQPPLGKNKRKLDQSAGRSGAPQRNDNAAHSITSTLTTQSDFSDKEEFTTEATVNAWREQQGCDYGCYSQRNTAPSTFLQFEQYAGVEHVILIHGIDTRYSPKVRYETVMGCVTEMKWALDQDWTIRLDQDRWYDFLDPEGQFGSFVLFPELPHRTIHYHQPLTGFVPVDPNRFCKLPKAEPRPRGRTWYSYMSLIEYDRLIREEDSTSTETLPRGVVSDIIIRGVEGPREESALQIQLAEVMLNAKVGLCKLMVREYTQTDQEATESSSPKYSYWPIVRIITTTDKIALLESTLLAGAESSRFMAGHYKLEAIQSKACLQRTEGKIEMNQQAHVLPPKYLNEGRNVLVIGNRKKYFKDSVPSLLCKLVDLNIFMGVEVLQAYFGPGSSGHLLDRNALHIWTRSLVPLTTAKRRAIAATLGVKEEDSFTRPDSVGSSIWQARCQQVLRTIHESTTVRAAPSHTRPKTTSSSQERALNKRNPQVADNQAQVIQAQMTEMAQQLLAVQAAQLKYDARPTLVDLPANEDQLRAQADRLQLLEQSVTGLQQELQSKIVDNQQLQLSLTTSEARLVKSNEVIQAKALRDAQRIDENMGQAQILQQQLGTALLENRLLISAQEAMVNQDRLAANATAQRLLALTESRRIEDLKREQDMTDMKTKSRADLQEMEVAMRSSLSTHAAEIEQAHTELVNSLSERVKTAAESAFAEQLRLLFPTINYQIQKSIQWQPDQTPPPKEQSLHVDPLPSPPLGLSH